uniref:Neutral zinc metallopeptidase n=1 Tax=Solibacter usitatus (strain Ellin6076) TaxID=234267 RepID=Q01WW4_SOLUE
MGGAPLGIGGMIVLVLLSLIFKRDFVSMFSGSQGVAPTINQASRSVEGGRAEAKQVQFVSFVLDDAQSTWDRVLPQQSKVPYRHAKLVLFRDATESACGLAQSATGPFYCPADEKVYVDLGFFDELGNRFGAPGEFAQAYVLAHEIGHHVQKVLGISGKVHALQQSDPSEANPLSVSLELQADCLAGVWANSTAQRDLIEQQDVEAGIRAAGAVGDDRLQRMAGRRVSPENFTHGSSAQRAEWFQRGLASGDLAQCNTFAGR